jgi:drug/metabolite transporter (DMT)-like permease
MGRRLIVFLAILLAVVGSWSLYELVQLAGQPRQLGPDQPGVLPFFFALLFAAASGILTLPAVYLNRRFAPEAMDRDPWRAFRQGAWGGLCVTICAWLQLHRVFSVGFGLIIALMFVAVEVLIIRLRAEP